MDFVIYSIITLFIRSVLISNFWLYLFPIHLKYNKTFLCIKVAGRGERNRKRTGLKVRRKMTAEERLRKANALDQEDLINSDNNYIDVQEENGKF